MINPFQYGGIVGKEAFCNRELELHDLLRAAQNGDRLLVYAERRLGKTSLVRLMLSNLPKSKYLPIYIDLWATSDTVSFVRTVAKAVAEAGSTRADKMIENARELFRNLSPSLTIDDSGNPSIQFGVRSGVDPEPQIEEVLDAPARLARKRDRQVIVVYDEIQRIAEYGDDLVERMLRSHVQTHTGIAYFFLGSRKHLVHHMFMEKSRPLYQSAGHYPLGKIETRHWIPFIRERFHQANKIIEDALIALLCKDTDGHPYYTQHLAHDLWEITREGERVTEDKLRQAEDLLLERLSYTYSVLWESLTINQQALLRGIAEEDSVVKLFSSRFLQKYNIAASSAHRAVEGLLHRDLIDREDEGHFISDRFFRLWLRRL